MSNKVYVLNKCGHPLMPCSPAKARHLLDDGKAKVKKRTPFTIQLVYGSSGYTQEVILGVDAGSKTIGMSASTTKEELLSAEVKPRNDVVDLLSTRREETARPVIASRASITESAASTRDGWRLLWRSKSKSTSPQSRGFAASCP